MSLLLFVALLGYHIASRINQSVVVGEILVGLIIGPSLLNLITYTNFVELLARVGAVILLFVIGLEFRFENIYKVKYFIIALAGVILPWLGGYALAQYYLFDFKTSIFIGTALTATSIAITANVLREMGKLKTEVAEAIIGAAVIDDILGLMALSISEGLVSTGGFSYVSLISVVVASVAFVFGAFFIGRPLITRVVQKIDGSGLSKRYPELVFIFAMMMAFLYALVAEMIGLSSIVGAFLAGVSMESIVLKNSRQFKEGAEYLHIIFAAIFFVSLGIIADIRTMTLDIVIFLGALVLVAVLTKVVGCGIAAKLQGMSRKDSLIVGFGMSPRGEVAMIVALIGLSQGIIGQPTYVSLVLMSLITTLITPIVLRNWLYKK